MLLAKIPLVFLHFYMWALVAGFLWCVLRGIMTCVLIRERVGEERDTIERDLPKATTAEERALLLERLRASLETLRGEGRRTDIRFVALLLFNALLAQAGYMPVHSDLWFWICISALVAMCILGRFNHKALTELAHMQGTSLERARRMVLKAGV